MGFLAFQGDDVDINEGSMEENDSEEEEEEEKEEEEEDPMRKMVRAKGARGFLSIDVSSPPMLKRFLKKISFKIILYN